MWYHTRFTICAQALHDQRPDFATNTHVLIQELNTVAERKALCDEIVENQIECTFPEEVRADVQVASVFRAEGERFLTEAMFRHMGQGSGQDVRFDFGIGRWRVMLVGVIEGSRGLLNKERAEGGRGAEKSTLERHDCRLRAKPYVWIAINN